MSVTKLDESLHDEVSDARLAGTSPLRQLLTIELRMDELL